MTTRHRCILSGLVGTVLGFATLAFAQSAPPADLPIEGAGADQIMAIVYLVQAFGLPAILGALFWALGRAGGIPVSVTVKLSPEDRKALLERTESS